MGNLDSGKKITYDLRKKGNGVYVFVLSGDITVADQPLSTRDGFGIWDTDTVDFQATSKAEILVMEVPMLA
jgi:redox-sensitive bicupin YhaK (pirin superfamily)